MPDPQTLALWALAFAAAWTQTLTGFALGLILMGGCGLFGLLPLPEAALVTSVLVLVNGSIVLRQGWRQVDRQVLALTLAGTAPMLAIGFALLGWLAGQALWLLQLLLGLLIAGSALQLAARPQVRAQRSPAASFVAAGAAGGLLGGLFATAGPPIIWHLYRQPMTLGTLRVTLVAVFAINQALRLAIAAAATGIGGQVALVAAGA
ncbi:MAG: TSUP family transporter, partial [Paracoccaceae bacterium]